MRNLPSGKSSIEAMTAMPRRTPGISRKSITHIAGILLLSVAQFADAQSSGAPRLQGQVPLADQLSGRALLGYQKNVRLVGRNDINGRLQNGNLGWVDDCAYISGIGPGDEAVFGTAVLDVSRPRNPRLVKILPHFPAPMVEANADSRILAHMGPRGAGLPSILKIYDIPRGDCTSPVLRGTYDFGREDGASIVTHEHTIWRDKVYATVTFVGIPGPSISVVDASDKDNPFLLTTWDLSDEAGMPASAVHDLSISPDGTRAYVNLFTPRLGGPLGSETGLAILDTSEVVAWRPGMPRPTIRRISRIAYWGPPMPGLSHTAQLVKIKGRKYVITQNESTLGSPNDACPAGWAQIMDVNDELNPTVISSFLLEVNRVENCPKTIPDHDGIPAGPVSIFVNPLRYSAHFLGVDNAEEAKYVAFTWYASGLRIVDISDPYSPKEVGYFIPPAINIGGPRSYPDRAYSYVRFHENGNIWFNSINGGFWVVRLTPRREGPIDD